MAHETIHIGLYVIFGIILLPVYAMLVGWIAGKPRDFRTVGLSFAYMFGFVVLIIAGLGVLGAVVSFITPY